MGKCAICGKTSRSVPPSEETDYVCKSCDRKAVNKNGEQPWKGFKDGEEPESDGAIHLSPDQGENPVFIKGHKCKRRYRFGGHITKVVEWNSEDCPNVEDWDSKGGLF